MLDEISFFTRGLIIGLMVAAPVGPVGLLCMRRCIQKGFWIAFFTGLGAVVADTFFGSVAAFGITVIREFLINHNNAIRLIGGAFLLFVAWHTWHDKLKEQKSEPAVSGGVKAFLSGLIITLTNPATIFAMLAVIATFGEVKFGNDAKPLIAGIFAGGLLWWTALVLGIFFVRKHFTESRLTSINRATAIILAIAALWAFISGITGIFGVHLPFISRLPLA